MKKTQVRLWTTKAQNASRASLAHCYIMLEKWTTSYLSALVPSDPIRPPQRNAPKRQSIRYLITVLHTPPMEFSIALVTWFYVQIPTQVFTMKAKGSRSGARIFLYKNDAMLRWNGSAPTLAQMIKFVMYSASEAELGAIFITAQEMVVMRNTLEEIKWPQPKSPIQTENSAAAGVVNNTVVPIKLKTMDHRLHWLRCR